MRQILILLFVLLSGSVFAKENHSDWWLKANKLYEQKEYEGALAYYERIAALNPGEAQVYYNLGNTYYKLNDIGHAVLNYEKALKLDPDNKQIQDNLALTQSRISNRIATTSDIFFVRWWKNITSSTKAGMWATISLITFLALIGLAIALRLGKITLTYAAQVNGIGWSLCGLFLVLAFASAQRKASHNKAVVMQNDSPFYVSPEQAKAQAYISEGITVKFRDEKQGWAEVTLPDGRSGWMQLSALGKV